jgi:hypothetical protein
MKRYFGHILTGIYLTLTPSLLVAEIDSRIPDVLKPWIPWVSSNFSEHDCTILFNSEEDKTCAWPSVLTLKVDAAGVDFSGRWLVYRKDFLPLPGDTTHWPMNVKVDGTNAQVTVQNGLPSLIAQKGSHVISGRINWEDIPPSLQIPPTSGLIALTIKDKKILQPRLDQDGKLWLEQQSMAVLEETEDVLNATINRKIVDEIPLRMEIAIDIVVSGKSREHVFQGLFDSNFLATEVSSALPTKLEAGGRLTTQLRPGSWQIIIKTRHLGPATDLPFVANKFNENREEVWVFAANDKLRSVQITGAQSIDPNQTQLPEEWKHYPAFHMKPGEALHLEQGKRGDESPAPDELALRREQWLDFAGSGYTIRDTITGTLKRSWRIDMAKPTVLGQATVDAESQLITKAGDGNSSGIELRHGNVRVVAISRLEKREISLPASNWTNPFASVSSTLYLPPGWSIFAAFGVDQASPTWLGNWTNWGNFLLVALLAFSVAKLFSIRLGVVAFFALFLTLPDGESPKYLWLVLLAPIGLLRVIPEGRLRTLVNLWKYVAAMIMVVTASTFLFEKIRTGLYPQLESPSADLGQPQNTRSTDTSSPQPVEILSAFDQAAPVGGAEQDSEIAKEEGFGGEAGGPPPAAAIKIQPDSLDPAKDSKFRREISKKLAAPSLPKQMYAPGKSGSGSSSLQTYKELDPNAVIQTGPGLPTWHWQTVHLSWKGPVEAGQEMTILYLSPWMNFVLAILETILLCYLIAQLLRPKTGFPRLPKHNFSARHTASLVVLGLGLIANARAAQAEFPPEATLKQLGEIVNQPPLCLPECASISRVAIDFTPTDLKMRIEIHALEHVRIPLPISGKLWNPSTIDLDGKAAEELMRDDGQIIWIGLPAGVHQIIAAGAAPQVESMQIPFLLLPHHVSTSGNGWSVDGIHEDGVPDGALTLRRTTLTKKADAQNSEMTSSLDLPGFVKVDRNLRLGKKWQATTVVTSLTPITSGLSLKIPLLPGESVTTAGIHIKDRHALVSLNPQSTQIVWESLFEPAAELTLTAPKTNDWIEQWTVRPSQTWSFTHSGIPPITRTDGAQYYQPLWMPWEGESVTFKFSKPEAAAGASTTIESVELASTPGERLAESTLTVKLNSSRGTEKTITIPDGSELMSVNVSGLEKPLSANQTQIRVPILPGNQIVTMRWRAAKDLGMVYRTDKLSIDGTSANLRLRVNFPNRWILFLGGPGSGPVVLFWSRILLILALAWISAGLTPAPLRLHDWLLLGLGFAASPIQIALIFFGFMVILGQRRKQNALNIRSSTFNIQQLALAAWAILAVIAIVYAVNSGFIGSPDMQIEGNASSQSFLNWYLDRVGQELPQAWVFSLPIYVFQAFTFLWAIWVAYSMTKWVPWAWECFATGGYWKKNQSEGGRSRFNWMVSFARDRKTVQKDDDKRNPEKDDGHPE